MMRALAVARKGLCWWGAGCGGRWGGGDSAGASFSSDTPRSASMPGRSPSDSAARRGLPARAASPKRPSGCRTCAYASISHSRLGQ